MTIKNRAPGIGCLIVFLAVLGFFGWLLYDNISNKRKQAAIEAVKQIPTPILLSENGRNIKDRYPKWDNNSCNLISEGKISLKMSKEQVLMAWGKPIKIINTISSDTSMGFGEDVKEEWIMDETKYPKTVKFAKEFFQKDLYVVSYSISRKSD